MSGKKEDQDLKERIVEEIGIASIAYSVFKKAAVVGIVYAVGYLRWSVAWFICPVIFSVVRDQWRVRREKKRNIAKAAALANEKDVVLARIDDLPAWVFFPDIERAEWLNKILKQVWPNVNHYARNLIRDSIQPSLQKKLEGFKLKGFKFERIILGSIPPRIGGVKVYDKNVSRTEIIMDIDLFYAGDCDIHFTLSGIKGGIKDLQVQGMIRVIMKPLITTLPLVGGLQVFFLNNPEIDFNLLGAADVLDMPGLSDLLRKVIVEQIASMMVLPNKFPIKLSDLVEAAELKAPEPEGVLRVHVVEAKHLMKKDIGMLGKGKSDPYAVITVGAQEFKTKTINNSVDPKWDFWCEFSVLQIPGQQLYIHVFDADDASDDEPLGRAVVEVENIVKKGEDDMWITLEKAKHGMVHLRLTWLVLSKDLSDLREALEETQRLRVTAMSTAILTIFIDSAKNLPQMRSTSKPDPYVVARLGKTSHQTQTQMRTSDPVWEEGFTFLVANPETDTLYLTIMDQKTGLEIGNLTYNLTSLARKKELETLKEPFGLGKAGTESKIILSMHLRVLKKYINEAMQADESGESSLEFSNLPKSSTIEDTQKLKESEQTDCSIIQEAPCDPPPPYNSVQDAMETEKISPLESSQKPEQEQLLHRTVSSTSSAGEAGLGRIQLTLKYSMPRQKLIVVVHKINNIPMKDQFNIPDPYVKLHLLPERSKDSKRKTVAVKDNCNPVFDESFEYVLSPGDLNTKQLEVTVGTKKQLFYDSSNVLGQVIIDLAQLNLNLMQPYTAWYDLKPEN